MLDCPDLSVPMEIMQHVIKVESSHNPYAIGVVGGRLARQPINQAEAIATVKMLEEKGYNFSLGIAQVNRYNLTKYGLPSYESAFDACPNLQAGSQILRECYDRSQDWGKAFSCYYSGNFVTGYKHGYVQKIFASMRASASTNAMTSSTTSIPVYSNPGRRPVSVTHHAAYSNQAEIQAEERTSTQQMSSLLSRRIVSVATRRNADAAPARIESSHQSSSLKAEAPPAMAVLAGSKEDMHYLTANPASSAARVDGPSKAKQNVATADGSRATDRATAGATSTQEQHNLAASPAVAILAGTEGDITRPVQTISAPKMQDPAFVY